MKKLLFAVLLFSTVSLFSCSGTGFVVTSRLDAPVYTRPVAPGPDFIWIDGDWVRNGNGYGWHEGHWDRRRPNKEWHGGRWEQHGNGYTWHRGGWQ